MFKYVHTTNPIEEIPIMELDTPMNGILKGFPIILIFPPFTRDSCLLCHQIFSTIAGMQFNSIADRPFFVDFLWFGFRNSTSWWWSDYQLLSAVKTQLFARFPVPLSSQTMDQPNNICARKRSWKNGYHDSAKIANWVGTWCSLHSRMPRTFLHKLSNNLPFVCTNSKQLLQPDEVGWMDCNFQSRNLCFFFSSHKLVIGVCIAFFVCTLNKWWGLKKDCESFFFLVK